MTVKKKLVRKTKPAHDKKTVRLYLSPEVLDYFKSKGAGWQTRIDRALQAFVEAAR